jgi:hypothetical protein
VNHDNWAAAVALVHVVDSEPVKLDPSFLKRPTFEIGPTLPDQNESPILEIVGVPTGTSYRTVVTSLFSSFQKAGKKIGNFAKLEKPFNGETIIFRISAFQHGWPNWTGAFRTVSLALSNPRQDEQ